MKARSVQHADRRAITSDILTEEQFKEAIIKISASEGLRGAEWVKIQAHDSALRVAIAVTAFEAEIKRLKDLIDRDRTGLARALSDVLRDVASYSWIPDGEWSCYEHEERTETTLRAEVKTAFAGIRKIARDALRNSGILADLAFHKTETVS